MVAGTRAIATRLRNRGRPDADNVGASLASNCIPCINYHIQKGREAGLPDEAIGEAIEVADAVRQVPARKVKEAATVALGRDTAGAPRAAEDPTCGGADGEPQTPTPVGKQAKKAKSVEMITPSRLVPG